jgi:hypothetical protein
MKKPTLTETLPGAVVGGLFALILLLGIGRSLGDAAATAGIIALAAIPALYFGRLAGYRRSGRR